jgi:hypothetical protein
MHENVEAAKNGTIRINLKVTKNNSRSEFTKRKSVGHYI